MSAAAAAVILPPMPTELCKLRAIKSTTAYILEKTEQMIHVICKLNAING